MIINLKTRFQNKVTLLAIALQTLTIIYKVSQLAGFNIPVPQDEVYYIIELMVGLMVMLGVVTDPNTTGASDSARALEYKEPAPNVKEIEKETPEE